MKITESDVDHVARLANLEVLPEEKARLAQELSRILDFVDQLKQLDVTGIEPTPQVVTSAKHAIRDDRVARRTGSSEVGQTGKLFRVPKVITER